MAAIEQGARVVLTSRSYIYAEARPLLKEYVYPRLRERQVCVDVEKMTADERRQILYNHLGFGDQSHDFRRSIKPFLERAAAAEPFRPEVARRLGLRAFTTGLSISYAGVDEFMTSPRQFLRDVYTQLGADEHAALSLVYASGQDGCLKSPLDLGKPQRDIILRAGSTAAGAAKALQSLTGTFLKATGRPLAKPGWAFRHPTLWEGFASWVPTQTHLLPVVLACLDDNALITQTDCEDENADEKRGVLLRVPPALYRDVAERLATIGQRPRAVLETHDNHAAWQRAYHSFLARRSSSEFLRIYLQVDPKLPQRLLNFGSYVYAVPQPAVLARLHRAGLLPEHLRREAVERMAYLAVETPDPGWTDLPEWQDLLTRDDREQLIDKVCAELVPNLDDAVSNWLGSAEPDDQDPIEDALRKYGLAFEAMGNDVAAQAFEDALDYYQQGKPQPPRHETWPQPSRTASREQEGSLAPLPAAMRSVFDDIDS